MTFFSLPQHFAIDSNLSWWHQLRCTLYTFLMLRDYRINVVKASLKDKPPKFLYFVKCDAQAKHDAGMPTD